MDGNASWRTLLPDRERPGMAPQVGRVHVTPACARQRLVMPGGRAVRGVRAFWREADAPRFVTLVPGNGRMLNMLNALRGGETVEFVGHSREWHGMDGVTCWAVVVTDMDVTASTVRPRINATR